tara:strand:+ start:71018 stop:71263 length:246 start_codon:yes stop_codon:yes gene_type:complete
VQLILGAKKCGINRKYLPKVTLGGRFIEAESGTIINVEQRCYDIKWSDNGVHWRAVFTVPKDDVGRDTAVVVYEKVNAVRQ